MRLDIMKKNKKKICILSLDVGNCISIKGRLEKLNYNVNISNNLQTIRNSNILIIPGVGNSEYLMKKIMKLKLKKHIQEFAKDKKKKIIGLCAGMQILGKFSEEGNSKCLELIDSNVKKINHLKSHQIPNIGFRKIINKSLYFEKYDMFYFNHSYEMKLKKKSVRKFYINYFKKKYFGNVCI
jgi:glutamine amidotransferase